MTTAHGGAVKVVVVGQPGLFRQGFFALHHFSCNTQNQSALLPFIATEISEKLSYSKQKTEPQLKICKLKNSFRDHEAPWPVTRWDDASPLCLNVLVVQSLTTYYGLTIDFVKVDLAYFVNDVFVIESDKSESPMAVGDFIVSKHRLLDPTELFKVRFDVLQAG